MKKENDKNSETAKLIINCFGGEKNIKTTEKSITRIKIWVDNITSVQRQNLKQNLDIIGVIKSNDFLEIVMNFELIDNVYNNILYALQENKENIRN